MYLSKNINWFELSCLEFEHMLSEWLLYNSFLPWHVPSYAISVIIDYQAGNFLKFEWCLWTIMFCQTSCLVSVSGEHVFWCWSFGQAGKIWSNKMTWLGKTCEILDANLTFSWQFPGILGKLKHESLKTMKLRFCNSQISFVATSLHTSTISPVIPYLRILKPTLPFNSTEEASSHDRCGLTLH